MALKFQLKVEGLAQLRERFKKLEAHVGAKILNTAMNNAAKHLRHATKRHAPIGASGDLVRSIKVRRARKKRHGVATFMVQTKDGDFKGKQFYAAFLEYGTKERVQKKTGRRVGKVTARSFFRQALENERATLETMIANDVREGMEKAAAQ